VFQVLVGIESVPTWVLAVCSIGITLVFCILNYFKIAISVRIEFIMAAIMVITGMIIAFMFIGSDHFTVANMKPYFAQGSMGFIICIGAMIMMFCGFDIVPQMAEEGNYPRRKSVWVMVGSVWIMGAIYIIASIGQSGMMPTSWLVKQMVIDPEIAKMHWGVFPWALVLTAALGACLTSLNAFIMAATRVIFGLGRSGVLPPVLGHVNKYGVPDAALLFGFVASALIVGWAGEQWLNYILPGASVYIGVVYGLSAVSLVTLRKKHPKWNRPYTITGGIPMAWIAAIIAFGATIFAATALPAGAWLLTALYLIVGVGIWVYMIMKSGEAYEEVLMTPDDIHPETD
jgi:APA family basic amino acid/polyamine antiporter